MRYKQSNRSLAECQQHSVVRRVPYLPIGRYRVLAAESHQLYDAVHAQGPYLLQRLMRCASCLETW